jgi:EAL domain-containing protein (putative c-di-GMP-specific phosphodiesterase class I)
VEAIANHSLRKWRGLAVGAAVEAALREDRLFFAFQPVVCAATGTVDYFECLLRMRDAEGGVVSGGEFITIIEELGWIGLIDRYRSQQNGAGSRRRSGGPARFEHIRDDRL